jgi:hypothetical protein
VLLQEVAQRLQQRAVGEVVGGDLGAQAVEAQHVGQHAQKRGLNRLRFCANTVARSLPLHSSAEPRGPAPGTWTENDMSDARFPARQLLEQRDQVGIGALVVAPESRCRPRR